MPVFSYVAADRGGRQVTGSLAADTSANARRMLREQGMSLLEFRRAPFRTPRLSHSFRRKRRQDEAADFARQLSLLLRTGIPVVEAIDVLIRQQRGRFLPVLRDTRDRVAAGTKFSDALEAHPQWFDDVFRSAVKVGQLAGHMERALTDLAHYIQERQGLRNKLFTALAYPSILAVLGLAVVIFLMSYVVPQLLQVLESSGRALPATTVFLKSISDGLVSYWPAITILGAVLCGSGMAFYGWIPGRKWLHTCQLRLPLLGPLIRKSVVAQFSQMMAMLLKSGVTFLDALRLVRKGCKHLVLAQELKAMLPSPLYKGGLQGGRVSCHRLTPTLPTSRRRIPSSPPRPSSPPPTFIRPIASSSGGWITSTNSWP